MSTFVIAEAGVNHNGSVELALEMVDVAADCGADAIKFQTFSAEKLVRRGAEKAEYQKRETGDGDQFSMLKALELNREQHRQLFERCKLRGIEFMSTAFDEDSLDFLLDIGMKRCKVPSGELTNHPFLRYLASKGLPLIVSTGMSSLEEVREAVDVIAKERDAAGMEVPLENVLTILHCTSNYPAMPVDVNLRAMCTMAEATGMPVGYSDHTLGLAVSVAAVAMGAQVIEKHFTLDREAEGPDHRASLKPDELKELVRQIRDVEAALGSPIKQPTQSELQVRAVARRSVTTAKAIQQGQLLQLSDLVLLRPGSGIAPKDMYSLVGRVASKDIPEGSTLFWSDIQ